MELFIKNKNLLKHYNLNYIEKRYLDGVLNENINKNSKIAIEYFGKNITFKQLSKITEKDGLHEKILELAHNSFNNIKFTIDSNGKLNKIRNLDEISKNWENTKKYYFSHIKEKNINDFIFEISKLIKNEEALTEMVKKYNVIPYLFMGLYNQEYSESFPVRINTDFYNIFSSIPIPVILEIYGKNTLYDCKALHFTGKEDSSFDRFTYMDTFEKKYPELKDYNREDFDMKINGVYIYDPNNLLIYFEVNIALEVRKKFKGKITYTLKEEV